MTAREYLLKLKDLDIKINQKLTELQSLKESLYISQAKAEVEKVKGKSKDKDAGFVKIIAKIDYLEKVINKEIESFIYEKHKIIAEIQMLKNSLYVEFLYKRYVEFKRLEEIAEEMSYSFGYIRKVHKLALEEFYKTILLNII